MQGLLSIAPELVEAELARRDLATYAKLCWPALGIGSELAWGWHHDAICEHLEAVTRGEITRLIVNVPPRTTKSTLVSVLWPSWAWLRNSRLQWLTGSHSIALATRDAVATRRLVESSFFSARWPGVVRFTSDQNTKTRYDIDGGGSRIVFGVGAGVTGEGGDVVLLDDPHSARDGMWSDAARARVIEAYDHEISTRLNDPVKSAIVVVMQRLHVDDLSGHLLRRGGWAHLRLPMEFEASTPCATTVTPKRVTSYARRQDDGTWRWDKRTADGELLQPDRFTSATVADMREALGPYGYSGQGQQRPVPVGGAIVTESMLRTYDRAELDAIKPANRVVVQSWDLTFKRTAAGSYVVGQLWLIDWPRCYLVDQVRARLDFVATLAEIRKASTTWAEAGHVARAILVEDKANGPAVVSVLQRELQGVIARDVDGGDKVARLHSQLPIFAAGNVRIPSSAPWLRDYRDELLSFPFADHDDQVDATTQALAYATEINARRQAGAIATDVIDWGQTANPYAL